MSRAPPTSVHGSLHKVGIDSVSNALFAGAVTPPVASSVVRTLVDRSTQAALAVDGDGRIVYANGLFEAFIGRARASVLEHLFVDTLVPSELAAAVGAALGRAFAGELTTLVATVEQEGGAWIELVMDALPLDDSERRVLLLTTRAARLSRASSSRHAFGGHTYTIRATSDGFRLDDGEPCALGSAREPGVHCYEELGARGNECGNCPAAAALCEQKELVAVLSQEAPDRFVVVRARPIDGERVAMERVVLDALTLVATLRERIHRVATHADLSARELDVLECLLLGRSLEDAGTILGVSRHTTKFHQANILKKLGADSRFDLIRILL